MLLLLGLLLLLLLHGSHDRCRGLLLLVENLLGGRVPASEGRAQGPGVGHGSHSL